MTYQRRKPKRPGGVSFEELRSAYLAKAFKLKYRLVLAAVRQWNAMPDDAKVSFSAHVPVVPK